MASGCSRISLCMKWACSPLPSVSSSQSSDSGTLMGCATLECAGVIAIGSHHGELAIIQVHDAARVAYQRRRIGRHEHLALTQPKNDRAAVPGDHQCLGSLRIQHRDAVGAADEPQGRAYRVGERLAVHHRNQVCQHFSESVSDRNCTPLVDSCARSAAAFSMMPLCTMAMRFAVSV